MFQSEEKDSRQLNAIHNSGLDHFVIKDIIGTTGKTWMESELDGITYQCKFPGFWLSYCDYVGECFCL